MIWMDVDSNLSEVPVNAVGLTDDTDFKSLETSVAYNAAGMSLEWHFVTTAGAYTVTSVTPTTGGTYDWAHQGKAKYTIEIPASGGASINNDTEGYGWFEGSATGVLPWRGPTIGFRAAAINDAMIDGGDLLDVSVTQLGGVTQSATDLKDFADTGYDPATHAVKAVTDAVSLPSIPNNWLTAAGIASGAITSGKFAADAIDSNALAASAITDIHASDADTSGVTTLLSRLSSARAGYLDNLSAGAVALASNLTGDPYAYLTTNMGLLGANLTAADDSVMTRLGSPAGASIAADIATRAPSSTALSTAQWTSTRAGYLDNVNNSALGTLTDSSIADQVWDEILSGHAVSGSTGEALSAAGGAGDPWITALPGSYTAGQAGYILGTNLNALISSRMATFTLPTNFSSLLITGGGFVAADLQSINGDSTAADNAEHFFDGTGYAGTNNVIPHVTLVDTTTDLTNGGGSAPTADEIADEVQTRELILTSDYDAAKSAASQASVDTIDGLVDQLIAAVVTAQGEPGQGALPVSASLDTKIAYIYKILRNKAVQNDTTQQIYADDGTTVDHKRAVSASGGVLTLGEVVSGP